MTKLSRVANIARRIAWGNGRNYPEAVREAWKKAGYPQPQNTIRETYFLDNDIKADPGATLEAAILSYLGRLGAAAAREKRAARLMEGEQFLLEISSPRGQ